VTAADGPPFARDFPEDPDLALLVRAFEDGNFAHVRQEAPKLAARATDTKVKDAAALLVARTEADPLAKVLLALTLALLVGLTVFWLAHDSPASGDAPKPPPPAIERITDTPHPAPPKPAGS
jgi:hypothetical protein